METRLTLRPGQNGTRKLAERFGKRLIRVRYRYDEERRKRYTTVELIVAESDWAPRARKPRASRPPDEMVLVRVAFGEEGLRSKLKALGALWRPRVKLWELPWGAVRALAIEDRVVQP
ncbi:MAG: hypothetical protein A3H97_01975 [Acidobacteria bacterium RIFCSPLOWO2_02_FULL_65_29]|nr:MAG: hypothetical protein A3H97_01975 [Acidobacteria bacterium RIFCSPLOWO2_02_FULL_65_29]